MKEFNNILKQLKEVLQFKNTNDIIKLLLTIVVLYLLFNQKYILEVMLLFLGVTVLAYSFNKNILNSMFISALLSYVVLTYYYKMKLENFKNNDWCKKLKDLKLKKNDKKLKLLNRTLFPGEEEVKNITTNKLCDKIASATEEEVPNIENIKKIISKGDFVNILKLSEGFENREEENQETTDEEMDYYSNQEEYQENLNSDIDEEEFQDMKDEENFVGYRNQLDDMQRKLINTH